MSRSIAGTLETLPQPVALLDSAHSPGNFLLTPYGKDEYPAPKLVEGNMKALSDKHSLDLFTDSTELHNDKNGSPFNSRPGLSTSSNVSPYHAEAHIDPQLFNSASGTSTTERASQWHQKQVVADPVWLPTDESLKESIQIIEIEEENLTAAKAMIEERGKLLASRKSKIQSVMKFAENELKRPEFIRRDIQALDSLIASEPDRNSASEILLGLEIEKDKELRLQAHARGLLALAKARIERRWNYMKLLGIIAFFTIYASVLVLQRDTTVAYEIESSVILSNIMGSLPVMAPMSFFNGGGPGSRGQLTTNDDFYTWLNDSIINHMYQDAVCGDSICDAPEETPGVGRFGCKYGKEYAIIGFGLSVSSKSPKVFPWTGSESAKQYDFKPTPPEGEGVALGSSADCGSYPADLVVTINVDLKTVMLQRFINKPSLGSLDPLFRYNIFSAHFNDYIFADMMDPSSDTVVQFEALRDDSLELRLFQTQSLADFVDLGSIATSLHLDRNSVPSRQASFDWAYADIREILAVSQHLASSLQKYCWNRVGGLYNARLDDDACSDSDWPFPQGFPNYFTNFEALLQILASYGISGDVTVPTTTNYGLEVQTSLISGQQSSSTQPAVAYCTPISQPIKGVPTGASLAQYIVDIGAECSESRRRHTSDSTSIIRSAYDERNGSASTNGLHSLILESKTAFEVDTPFDHILQASNQDGTVPDHRLQPNNRTQRLLLQTAQNGLDVNPLNMTLTDVAFDDRGFWLCYTGPNDVNLNKGCWNPNAQFVYDSINTSNMYGYAGAVSAAVDIQYSVISIFASDPTLLAMQNKWISEGGPAPSLKDAQVDMHLRYCVDGTKAFENDPDCNGEYVPPQEIKAFEYSFKTRIRLWNTRATKLRVWLCDNSYIPSMVSLLDIGSKIKALGRGPLEPGPHFILTVPLVKEIGDAAVITMKEAFCKTVFSILDERCQSRGWVEATRSQLKFTFLGPSNSRVTRSSYLVTQQIQTAEFQSQFPQVLYRDDIVYARVQAPGPYPKLTRESTFGCVTHYDCGEGLFCTSRAFRVFAKGFRGSGGPGPNGFGCDLCKYCLNDFTDPIDVRCPRDKCGIKSGLYPECVDAQKLFGVNFTCRNTYTLNMSRIPPVTKTSPPTSFVPLSSPNSTVRKARFLTPYNEMVGAVVISQKRRDRLCVLRNDTVGRYAGTKDPELGPICRGSSRDANPFGSDPTFSATSGLYRGDISHLELYTDSELDDASQPFGFYPHSYDGIHHSNKSLQYVMAGEESTFKLYISEEVDAVVANRLMTYVKDGGFLDFQTDEVVVEIITLNSNLNIFAMFAFIFKWQNGGKILWDYNIKSVPVYLYQESNQSLRILLELLCVLFLVIECVWEFIEILRAVKMFQIWKYMRNIWNVLDIIHFFVMWLAWALWLDQYRLTNNLRMPTKFNILKSASRDSNGRLFLTLPDGEFQFLEFQKYLKNMMQNLDLYYVLTSTSVILFVMRILKYADFQPRIALVTRTISNVFADLAHFMLLFSVVAVGYVVAGNLLFGHQYEGFSTLSNSFFYLLIMLIAFNPDEGWVQMNHAAPEWAFNVYLWTWILVALFILLNIFLAILINGYSAMQSSDSLATNGIWEEVSDIIVHESMRVIKLFKKDLRFISNEELSQRLSSYISSVHFDDTLEQYQQISVAGLMEIQSPSSEILTTSDIYKVLKAYFPEHTFNHEPDETNLYLDPTLQNVMMRFGKPPQQMTTKELRQDHIERFKTRLNLETMKRIAMTEFTAQESTEPAMYGVDGQIIHKAAEYSILSVVIERMKNLPKMDVFRGADPYCVIFLEGAPGLYQTEVRRGLRESDWTWDPLLSEDYLWEIPKAAKDLMPNRKLVVMIYDKDQLSNDDLIGCVTVGLEELDENGIFDGWKVITRPPNAARTQFFCHRPPVGELKLSISLSSVNVPKDSEPLTGQNQALRALEGNVPSKFALASTLGFPAVQRPNAERALLQKDSHHAYLMYNGVRSAGLIDIDQADANDHLLASSSHPSRVKSVPIPRAISRGMSPFAKSTRSSSSPVYRDGLQHYSAAFPGSITQDRHESVRPDLRRRAQGYALDQGRQEDPDSKTQFPSR